MSRIALLAIALATATPALAQPANPAYRDSGTHAGGPADDLISPTGDIPAPIRHTYSNPAYRCVWDMSDRGPSSLLRRSKNLRLTPNKLKGEIKCM